MPEVIPVASYGDLVRDDQLDLAAADAIVSALAQSGDAVDVIHLPRPLAEENVLDSEEGTDSVFVVDLDADRETGDAYYARQGRRTAWLPKGATRVYVEARDADILVPGHEQEGSA
ncbi:hypothetical protein [Halorussus halobius]|uniref:hypothetical protein n=1 Tax=Halorussus halobius TaxID=1710537 RepID=UPI001091B943|nr:hypothetical protein [Halorussus halobius]